MKKLLLATTILTSLSNLTLADSNNNYYFKIQPEFVVDMISSIQENSTASNTGNTEKDEKPFQASNHMKLEIGKYLNDYFALSISSSWSLKASGATNANMVVINMNSKLIPKLNLIAYKSDDTTIALSTGIGFHQIRVGSIISLDKEKKSTFFGDYFSGVIGEINLNIATNINSTANIGLDLGVSYSKLSVTTSSGTIVQTAISATQTAEKYQSLGFSIGLSAKFSV
jgi:hypothetical protein